MGLMEALLNAATGASGEKPGQLCSPACNINDSRCEACLAEQQKILDAVDEAQDFEQAINELNSNPAAAAEKNKFTKCSLCGAPFEKGMRSCPYCDTPYPLEALFADLPTNAIAQDNLLLEKAAAVSALYSALYKRQTQNSQEAIKAKLPSILEGAVGFVGGRIGNMMDMDKTEIKKYARENNASYLEYVLGVIQGTYKSPKRAMLDNQAEALNNYNQNMARKRDEDRERSRQIEEKQRQIAAERQLIYERQRQQRLETQEELKKIQQERHQRELERIKNNAPQYVAAGGGGNGAGRYCCGYCVHYMSGTNECTEHTWKPKGASDYCNNYSSR